MKTAAFLAALTVLAAGLAASLPGQNAAAKLTPIEELGKNLFFDKGLSSPAGQDCAACHGPSVGFTGPDEHAQQVRRRLRGRGQGPVRQPQAAGGGLRRLEPQAPSRRRGVRRRHVLGRPGDRRQPGRPAGRTGPGSLPQPPRAERRRRREPRPGREGVEIRPALREGLRRRFARRGQGPGRGLRQHRPGHRRLRAIGRGQPLQLEVRRLLARGLGQEARGRKDQRGERQRTSAVSASARGSSAASSSSTERASARSATS